MKILPRHRSREHGTTLVEVLVTSTILVVGLLAVTSATVSTSLIRRRGLEENAVHTALTDRLEWARAELFTASPFHDAVQAGLAGGESYQQSFSLDANGDGVQDLSFAADDNVTPLIQLTVTAPDPPADPSVLLRVQATAQWFGVGGQRTASQWTFVANRSGYDG